MRVRATEDGWLRDDATRKLVGVASDPRRTHCFDYSDDRSVAESVSSAHLTVLEDREDRNGFWFHEMARTLLARQMHHCTVVSGLDQRLLHVQGKYIVIAAKMSKGWYAKTTRRVPWHQPSVLNDRA